VAQFEFVVERRGFIRTMSAQYQSRGLSLLKNSILFLLLGDAAVYRCDIWPVFDDGFSRWGNLFFKVKHYRASIQRRPADSPGRFLTWTYL